MFGTVFDIEGDSLRPTKLHVLSLKEYDSDKTTKVVSLYGSDIASIVDHPIVVGHNIARFDIPVIERLYEVKFPKGTIIVDTLALSWYLYPKRPNHRLEDWGVELGYPKVRIDDWENLSREEYTERCETDVRITSLLWEKQYKYLQKLYGSDEKIKRFIRYLQFKLYCARLAEESGWKLDIDLCNSTIEKLEVIKDQKVNELRSVMPDVPVVKLRKRPLHVCKGDGEPSALGKKWFDLLKSRGLPPDHQDPVEVITGFTPANPNSHDQLKRWLFDLGWIPRTFKQNDKGVDVPKINKEKQDGGGVCGSIKDLEENHPELAALDGFFALSHRLGILRGFLRDVSPDGYLTAGIAGLTNTLRFKHSEIVNLPKPDLPYAADVRACLIADDGQELCGADMSSLEDRTKQHFMFPHDPEFVKSMMIPGFDPHLDLAEFAGKLSRKEVDDYKNNVYTPMVKTLRGIFKNGNYSCTYGAGPPRIAKTTGLPLVEAQAVHKAYWDRNWSLKAIAKEQKTKRIGEDLWLYNPVSRFWYSLRAEKDRFSTLNQGTGVFCFDTWVLCVVSERPQLTGQFHDEIIISVKKGFREQATALLRRAIDRANKMLNLNRELDIGIQFGENYGTIH